MGSIIRKMMNHEEASRDELYLQDHLDGVVYDRKSVGHTRVGWIFAVFSSDQATRDQAARNQAARNRDNQIDMLECGLLNHEHSEDHTAESRLIKK